VTAHSKFGNAAWAVRKQISLGGVDFSPENMAMPHNGLFLLRSPEFAIGLCRSVRDYVLENA
jgi:hypothetical protein